MARQGVHKASGTTTEADNGATAHPAGTTRTVSTTKERLLETATEQFAARGFEKVSVRDLAAQLDMTTGALYMHFRNKAELLAEGLDRQITRDLIHTGAGTDLPTYVLQNFAALSGRRGLRALLVEAGVTARTDPVLRDNLSESHGRRLESWLVAYRNWQDAGEAAADLDMASVVTVLWSVELGLGVLEAYEAVEVTDEDVTGQVALLLAAIQLTDPGSDGRGRASGRVVVDGSERPSQRGGWPDLSLGTGGPSPNELSPRAVETRSRLLAAATELFCRQGYAATSVRELARAADVTTGSIYGNYANKQSVLTAVVELRISEDLERIPDEVIGSSTPSQLVAFHLRDFERRRALRGLLLEGASAARWDPEARKRLREVQQEHLHMWAEAFRIWADVHDVDVPFDTLATVTVIWCAELGLGLLDAMGLPVPVANDVAELFERMLVGCGL